MERPSQLATRRPLHPLHRRCDRPSPTTVRPIVPALTPPGATLSARAEAERNAQLVADRAALSSAVYFEYDRDALTTDALSVLESKVPVLLARRSARIRIEGNADDRGSDEYNLALGQRRSAVVKRFLIARGIEDGRIETVSFGEEHSVCKAELESCWSRNRRDEFVIVAGADLLQTTPR
jgi:peptidoglycan-associated lipoprotein